MRREHAPGQGLNLNYMSNHFDAISLEEGFHDLALEIIRRGPGIRMAVVTNNDREVVLPILINNCRFHQQPDHQRPIRLDDFQKNI